MIENRLPKALSEQQYNDLNDHDQFLAHQDMKHIISKLLEENKGHSRYSQIQDKLDNEILQNETLFVKRPMNEGWKLYEELKKDRASLNKSTKSKGKKTQQESDFQGTNPFSPNDDIEVGMQFSHSESSRRATSNGDDNLENEGESVYTPNNRMSPVAEQTRNSPKGHRRSSGNDRHRRSSGYDRHRRSSRKSSHSHSRGEKKSSRRNSSRSSGRTSPISSYMSRSPSPNSRKFWQDVPEKTQNKMYAQFGSLLICEQFSRAQNMTISQMVKKFEQLKKWEEVRTPKQNPVENHERTPGQNPAENQQQSNSGNRQF